MCSSTLPRPIRTPAGWRRPVGAFIVRFSIPDSVIIGVEILRAELLLTPVAPIAGVPGIGTTVTARGVLSDQGAKSPLVPLLASTEVVTVGSADTSRSR